MVCCLWTTTVSSFYELFDLIGALARKRYLVAERGFAALGLNHTEARLLTLLDREGGNAGQEALSSMVHLDRTNVGRALGRLEDEGYLVREKHLTDKRAKVVRMTPKGEAAVVRIAELRRDMASGFFGDLTEAEAAQGASLLRRALEHRSEAEA